VPRGQRIPYKDNHKIVDKILYKKCNKHHIYFPGEESWFPCTTDYFYTNKKNQKDGLYPSCIKCDIKRSRIQQINNKEQAYEGHRRYRKTDKYKKWGRKHGEEQRSSGYTKEYYKNNPDKMKLYAQQHRNHDVSKTEEDAMLKVFNYACAYCGMTLKQHKKKYKEKLHKEHVDDSGANDLSNCIPACKGCNCSKYNNDMKEWYEKQEFYSEEHFNKIIWWITEGYKDYIEVKPPYKIVGQRIYNDDGTYFLEYELWLVDEKRDMVECITTGGTRKELKKIALKLFT